MSQCSLIARFMGPTWGPSGHDRTQMGHMLDPWTLLAGLLLLMEKRQKVPGYQQAWHWAKTGHSDFSTSGRLVFIWNREFGCFFIFFRNNVLFFVPSNLPVSKHILRWYWLYLWNKLHTYVLLSNVIDCLTTIALFSVNNLSHIWLVNQYFCLYKLWYVCVIPWE